MWMKVFSRALLLIFTVLPVKLLSSHWGLRLVDGDTPFNGRPEVYINEWKPFCDSSLHPNVATVICRMLGMPTNNVTLRSTSHVDNWDTWIVCDEGDTDLLTECGWVTWPETDCWKDKGLSCNGNVRLIGGTNDENGNIEFFHNGTLTSICDSNADFRVAQVVCRQLGREIGRAGITLGSYFGPGHPGTLQVACSGDEDSIERCRLNPMFCDASRVLGVDCNATQYDLEVVRVDSGRLSVNINTYAASGYWSEKIAGAGEDRLLHMGKIASIICYELGYSRYQPSLTEIPFDERFAYPLKLSEALVCSGLENRLSECSVKDDLGGMEYPGSATPLTEIGITCNDDLKLHGGINNYTGILMQRNDTDGTWHTFPDVRPDYAMGIVACRDLGHSSSNIEVQLKNLEGEAYTSLDVEHICSGEEPTLRDCQINQSNEMRSKAVIALNCDATTLHSELYISRTSGFIKRLSRRRLDGQRNFITSRVCTSTTTYDENTAAVICHQLGYTRSDAKITLLPSTEESVFYTDIARYACSGAEETIDQCPVYEEFNGSRCRFEVSMTCKDVSSCTVSGPKRRSKAVNCHNFQCVDNVCEDSPAYPNYDAPCFVDIGQGCMVSETNRLTAFGWKQTMVLGYCNPKCVPAFSATDLEYRTDECCYTEMCNSKTKVVRERRLFRVVDGILPWEGYVQFYSSSTNEWLYVLDHTLVTNELIGAFCTGSGYFENTFARSPNTGKTTPYDKNCVGVNFDHCNLQDLSSCFMSRTPCPEKNRLRINCNAYAPRARLIGGYSKSMGRVEIYLLERWGTVCTRGINKGVSDVLCRSLGFHGGCSLNTTVVGHTRFPAGTGSIHLENVSCVGNEDSILACNYTYVGKDSECSHEDDLGIICEDGTVYSGEVYETNRTTSANVTEVVPSNTVAEYFGEFETTNTTTFLSPSKIRCLFGKCQAVDCEGTFTGPNSACKVKEDGACFVKRLESDRSGTVLMFGCINNECPNGTILSNNGQTLTISVHCCSSDLCNAFIPGAFSEMNDGFVKTTEKVSSTENSIDLEAMFFDKSTQEVLLVQASTENTTSLAAVNKGGIWITLMIGLYMLAICWKL